MATSKSTAKKPAPKAPLKVPLSKDEKGEVILISAPRMQTAVFTITGISPYVQNAFSQKAKNAIKEAQELGSKNKTRKKREPKDFKAQYEGAKHISDEGWIGIPAPAFRNGMIDACRLVGFKMTHAKQSIFVDGDGFDKDDGTPLVKIIGKPRYHEGAVRLANGVCDLRARPMWVKWGAKVEVRWDADQFSITDVTNLLSRVGLQVGVGEGRPFSKNSNGMGWGLFKVESDAKSKRSA